MWNSRWCHRRFITDVGPGVAAAMAELDRRLCAARMDSRSEPRQAGQEAVIIDADLASAVTAGLGRRRHLHGDETDAAAHPRQVVADSVFGDEAILVGKPRRPRRHDDAVLDLDGADARGRQENVGLAHSVGTSPPSMSMVAPWSHRPWRDTMKAMRLPTSSGVPKRVTLMSARCLSRTSTSLLRVRSGRARMRRHNRSVST